MTVLRILAFICLCTILVATAVAKFLDLGSGLAPPALIAAVLECALVGFLIWGRTRRPAAVATVAGFAGAAIVTAIVSATTGLHSPCGCMGEIRLEQGTTLVLQGCLILLATIVMSERSPA